MSPPASEHNYEMSTVHSIIDYGKEDQERTYIARLIIRMEHCLSQLHVDVDADDDIIERIEGMAVLIHTSMSISSRNYHSVQHVFDISQNLDDPIAILAALFHDCVYYNIDGGLSPLQAVKLAGSLLIENNNTNNPADGTTILRVHPDSSHDELLSMVVDIFGKKPGQEITPLTGLNEFLSAVIAVRALEPLLPKERLAEIACCIEATVPFRPKDAAGTPMERLYQRLRDSVRDYKLNLTDPECVMAVQRAALLTNEDVGNFGSEDALWFLDNTWSLLPESNEALRHQFLYTVKEFHFAIFKMYGFFSFLKPEVVFHQFRSVPSNEELDRLTRNTRRNLELGRKYVGAKLLSSSVLAAIAELTGGDAPISLFMGDLPSRNNVSRRLEDTLPEPTNKSLCHCDLDVYNILAFGRRSETAFDVRQSPLAAFFYSILGDKGVEQILTSIKVHPMNAETAKALLRALPREAALRVAENVSKVAMSRRELIQSQVKELLN